jgi:hypothetical protein
MERVGVEWSHVDADDPLFAEPELERVTSARGPARREEDDWFVLEAAQREAERVGRSRVHPLDVVDCQK